MQSEARVVYPASIVRARDFIWPKEHGSWSLALEPLALGLLVIPSLPAAGLALAAVAGFFARRPLRASVIDHRADRRAAARRAVAGCGALALCGLFAAVWFGGQSWLSWLLPSAAAGSVFLYFDLQHGGREQTAEVAGAVAFSWLPAVMAASAGASAATALALAGVMLARSVPTVLAVRATIRARKTGQRHATAALLAAMAAVGIVGYCVRAHAAPRSALALAVWFAVRSFGLLVFPRPAFRAATIGMIEAASGVAFVVVLALTWH